MDLGTLKTIDCESEPCAARADAPVIGEEPPCVVRADAPVIGEESEESGIILVGDTGFEPVTSAMSTQRSNQLS